MVPANAPALAGADRAQCTRPAQRLSELKSYRELPEAVRLVLVGVLCLLGGGPTSPTGGAAYSRT